MNSIRILLLAATMTASLTGCAKSLKPDYARELAPGERALRLVTDRDRMPDLRTPYDERDDELLAALDRSIRWFGAPSSRQFFPLEGISHEQARASAVAMRELLHSAGSAAEFEQRVQQMFDVYESVGYDGSGTVLFTGYFAPIYNGSLTKSSTYRYPLYRRPADLATDPRTGEPQGRVLANGSRAPYPTRREIESSGLLSGGELVWLDDALSAYLVHINGSAKIRLDDGRIMHIGYAGKTDRDYASLGKAMVAAGLLDKDEVSLSAIRRVYQRDPQKVVNLMQANECYVFFAEYPGENWPAGSLGVPVTTKRSIATDKKIFPRGGVTIIDTTVQTLARGARREVRMMMDQDTGGAIRAPGRADLFMGIGPAAGIVAGGQHAEGRLFYLFLKPRYVAQYSGTPTSG